MSTPLTSLQNPHIKAALKLEKRSERARRRQTLVEGAREVTQALSAGIVPTAAFVCPERVDGTMVGAMATLERLDAERRTHLFTITPELFAKLAVREESGGVVLVIPFVDTRLDALPLRDRPFFAVIDRPEKPGNLGAILRTADAAGVDGVIVCGGVELHNPNVVRASLGALFTVPLAEATTEAAIGWLKARSIHIVAATPEAATRYTAIDMRGAVAIVTGSEAEGVSPAWLAAADARVVIPMFGEADSLNLATATALLLYEVVRQRGL